MTGLLSQHPLLCPLTVAVCSRWMKINARTLFPTSTAMSPDSLSLFSMDAWHLWKEMPGLFSQRLLLSNLKVAVCSRWMNGVYENKCQDSFPNIYCYVPWQLQFVLNLCLVFMKINARTLSQCLLLCTLTVAVGSRWMSGVYFHKCQDSFPTVYCYVLWQSQFVLDGCLAFIFINARTLFPTSTAMSPASRSLFSTDAWHYENKCQDSFPYIYCYVPWQSQFVLNGCLAFRKRNTRTPFPTSTAMFLDSSSLSLMDARRLFS